MRADFVTLGFYWVRLIIAHSVFAEIAWNDIFRHFQEIWPTVNKWQHRIVLLYKLFVLGHCLTSVWTTSFFFSYQNIVTITPITEWSLKCLCAFIFNIELFSRSYIDVWLLQKEFVWRGQHSVFREFVIVDFQRNSISSRLQ